jgi:hypothetical protein
VIGSFEAQAIAVAMERMTTNRPLTHDLFKNTLDTFQIDLQEIIINNLVEGVFYASLVCLRAGEVVEIDSRTSDALALAVRFNCPIYTYDFVMDEAGVVLDEEGPGAAGETGGSTRKGRGKRQRGLSSYSVEALSKMLDEVLGEENYEKAAEIRDEIKRREQAG